MNEEQMKYVANLISQDLEKDKEIGRLNTELELYKDNHKHLNTLLEQKDNIIKEAIKYMDNLKGEDFSTKSQYGYILVDYNRLVSILMGKPRFTNEKGE